jgi:hypothetical protein
MDPIEEKMQFIRELNARAEARRVQEEEEEARHERALTRAIRLYMQDLREEREHRKRRKERDAQWAEQMRKLAAAQARTEEALQRYLKRNVQV